MVLQLSIGSRDVLETYIGGTQDSSELIEIPWGDHAFDALPAGLSG